ncbi:MAG: hypothetical protein KJ000_34565, partial [Pirellulaceae bacterium]|nr:hypothetical protein [Pirellulaceae bacterium]
MKDFWVAADLRNRAYGERLLEHFRKLFHLIHRREEYSSEQTFRRALQRVRNELVCDATIESPLTRESENLADRFYLLTFRTPVSKFHVGGRRTA